jgi:hypothetical protein
MLADGFSTAATLSLVMPLALLAIVLGAWWIAARRGGLHDSGPQPQEADGGSSESRGA